MPEVPDLMRPETCAEIAHLHVETILRKCRSGELPATKPAGQWRIYADGFARWLRECEPREVGVGRPRRRVRAVRSGGMAEALRGTP